ncbi:MAG: hypothetical protein JRF72_22630 [Deltaproteobacteria bacterium]|jgi:hypothetical protein|nr:hypothetical protein [Deltaproteobacteria bacterium]
MKRPIVFYLSALILLLGCISCTTTPKYEYSPGTRIGIVNLLGDRATHYHYSSARIDSFTKKYDVDWELPEYVTDRITKILQKEGRYTIIEMEKADIEDLRNLQRGKYDPTDPAAEKKPEWAIQLNSLAGRHDLDVILAVYSYKGPSLHNIGSHRVDLEGYGVFSRWVIPLKLLPFKNAYSYAQIKVAVYKGNPVELIATGRSKSKQTKIKNFDWSGGPKNVPVSEINKAWPGVRKYAQKSIKRALRYSDLITTE